MSTTNIKKSTTSKLHLGCGEFILPGWVNHDMVSLPGVDVAHNLNILPWPFADNEFGEVRMINVLEHLPNTIEVIEELSRITCPGARICIHVPYWNARDNATDLTHCRTFSEYSFDFFDGRTDLGRRRAYYSKARFHILKKRFFVNIALGSYSRFIRVTKPWLRSPLSGLARHFCGVIWAFEVELQNMKTS